MISSRAAPNLVHIQYIHRLRDLLNEFLDMVLPEEYSHHIFGTTLWKITWYLLKRWRCRHHWLCSVTNSRGTESKQQIAHLCVGMTAVGIQFLFMIMRRPTISCNCRIHMHTYTHSLCSWCKKGFLLTRLCHGKCACAMAFLTIGFVIGLLYTSPPATANAWLHVHRHSLQP